MWNNINALSLSGPKCSLNSTHEQNIVQQLLYKCCFLIYLPDDGLGCSASSDSSVESISRDEWLWENQQLFPIKTLVLFIALRTTKLLWCYATHPLCHYSPHFEKVIFRHESFNYQAMTEAAIFTIGRNRIIGYGKIRPLVAYQSRSRLLNFRRYI